VRRSPLDLIRLRAWRAATVLVMASACREPESAPPAHIIVGTADTVVVNSRLAAQIPVRVLDAEGRELPTAGARFRWAGGDSLPISALGVVTCARRADASLRVSLDGVETTARLLCRPVASVRVAGPMQLILGDSAQTLPIQALDADGTPVDLFAMRVTFTDTTVVALNGLRVHPRRIKGTVAEVRIGEVVGSFGIHVYERVATLDGIRPEQAFVAVPLQLASGELRRWPLPKGQWMFTMMPYEDEASGLRMHVQGANCMPAKLTPRRIVCETTGAALVIVYNPWMKAAPDLIGMLLVRRVNS
jgi:hypothetical protein